MKKYSLTVLVVLLVCTFLTACSKEIDTMTESVNEKESSVIENPTVLEDTTEIVFPEQFEALSGYDEEALVVCNWKRGLTWAHSRRISCCWNGQL